MKIEIELDLPAIIAAAVTAERIQPIVDKAVSEAIRSAIDDATGYNSQFRKAVKSQLSEAMPHGLGVGDVAKFQLMINSAVTNIVEAENANTIRVALQSAAKSVMPDVPATIKLSELVKLARKDFSKDEDERFYANLEISEYANHLYLDRDANTREKYRADIHIAFSKEGAVYQLKLDGRQITPNSTPDAISRFDGLLLSMYVGRTTIDIDCDGDDVRHAASEQFD